MMIKNLYRCRKARMSQMKPTKWKTAIQILVITVNVNGFNVPVERLSIFRLDKNKENPTIFMLFTRNI